MTSFCMVPVFTEKYLRSDLNLHKKQRFFFNFIEVQVFQSILKRHLQQNLVKPETSEMCFSKKENTYAEVRFHPCRSEIF